MGLQRMLGLKKSFKTAKTLLHKPNRAMLRPDRDQFSGRVEVDEIHLGDDFVFRFNRGKSRSRGKLPCRLLEQALSADPVPSKSVVKCSPGPDF